MDEQGKPLAPEDEVPPQSSEREPPSQGEAGDFGYDGGGIGGGEGPGGQFPPLRPDDPTEAREER